MTKSIEQLKAKDVMQTNVIKVNSGMSVADLERVFQENHITGVPVVDQSGRLVGVVSETDIVGFNIAQEEAGKEIHPYFRSDWHEGDSPATFDTREEREGDPINKTVEEVMTPWTVTASEEAPLTEVAERMRTERVHRVLVTNGEKRLSGIISSMDLVHIIADAGKREASI